MKSKINVQGLMNQLEHEKNRVHKLTEENKKAKDALNSLETTFSAFFISAAIQFGEKREENGEIIGYRLAVDKINVNDLLSKWTSKVKHEGNTFVIGAFPKEANDGNEQ